MKLQLFILCSVVALIFLSVFFYYEFIMPQDMDEVTMCEDRPSLCEER